MRDPDFKTKNPEDHVLELVSVTSGYRGLDVIKDVSLRLFKGTMTGLLGPNGSGKSTLLLTASGFLRRYRGNINLFGKPLEDYFHKKRAQYIGAIHQQMSFFFPFTCEDIVWMGRYPWKRKFRSYTEEDFRIVKWAMELTETLHLAERSIFEVSGGERQRVLLARVLAQKAPLLLLDEPTSNMDIKWTIKTFSILKGLCSREGCTILVAIHDLNVASLFCDRLIFLKDGTKVAEGNVYEVFNEDILEKVYETKVIVYVDPNIGKPQALFPPL